MSQLVVQNRSATAGASDEQARLAAVYAHELLDTPQDPAFDAVVRSAAALTGACAAFIGLLDADRLWFKSAMGVDLAQAGTDAAHAGQPLRVIHDLSTEPGPTARALRSLADGLHAYAGVALLDEAGRQLGTLGVLSASAGAFGPAELQRLQDAALLAGTALTAHYRAVSLARAAKSDPVTGTADRRRFDEALDVELQYSMRTGEPFSVLSLAINGHTDIVTGFGRGVADDVLREVSRRLAQQVRVGDLLSHLGQAEFGIVMRHGAEAEARALAARIESAMAEPVQLGDGQSLGVSLSLGVGAYDDEVVSAAQLFGRAHRAQRLAAERLERRVNMVGKLLEAPALRLVASRSEAGAA
ncbi:MULTISPECIES: diguanylate cyclase domain-containing protein [Aquincola]|uniref:diguanylate cyclase domain-containing protein n=1 Tax=Aquincola TaxID=391952 RepID=UPI00061540FA|nr:MULTISPECIES: diguanylate cyclase [Aquincola]MCR5867065.1 diguanylate cyclase [Aquincola sp. J276]